MRIKWHDGSSSSPIYSMTSYQAHVYTNRKICMRKKFFILTHLCMLQRPTAFSFLLLFHAKKENTINNMSEEHLGNIRMHIISKIIQSIFGFLPEQLLSVVFRCSPPKSKSLAHPHLPLQMLLTSFISFSLYYHLIM